MGCCGGKPKPDQSGAPPLDREPSIILDSPQPEVPVPKLELPSPASSSPPLDDPLSSSEDVLVDELDEHIQLPTAPKPQALAPAKPEGEITVLVEDLRLRAYPLSTTSSMKVKEVYVHVQQQTGLGSLNDFAIFHDGKLLPVDEAEKTLRDCGITADSTLDLIYKH